MTIIDCASNDGEIYKTKMYSFQSKERYYMVAYTSNSKAGYDENIGVFDDSVDTLTIENTIEAPGDIGIPGCCNHGGTGCRNRHICGIWKDKVHEERPEIGAAFQSVISIFLIILISCWYIQAHFPLHLPLHLHLDGKHNLKPSHEELKDWLDSDQLIYWGQTSKEKRKNYWIKQFLVSSESV